MENLFELLSLPASLLITIDQIDEAWRNASRETHPDLGQDSDEDLSSRFNLARTRLSSPAGRLEEWLLVNGAETRPGNTALGDSLMELFSETGSALGEADEAIKAFQEAQTALARSLLTGRTISAQKRIQSQLGQIGIAIEEISTRFPTMNLENYPQTQRRQHYLCRCLLYIYRSNPRRKRLYRRSYRRVVL